MITNALLLSFEILCDLDLLASVFGIGSDKTSKCHTQLCKVILFQNTSVNDKSMDRKDHRCTFM